MFPIITINTKYILDIIVISYIIALSFQWRDFMRYGRDIFRHLYPCIYTQIRLWRKKYTKHELDNWNDKSRPDYPDGVKPSVAWFEVKYSMYSFFGSFLNPYYTIVHVLGNLIFYAPIIWTDAWWDFSFLLRIIEKKLRRDSIKYRIEGHHVGAEESADEMLEVAEICKRLREDDYSKPLYEIHEAKWGKLNMSFGPLENNDPDNKYSSGTHRMDMTRENEKTDADRELETEESRAIWKKEAELIQADLSRLSEIIRTKMMGWWD